MLTRSSHYTIHIKLLAFCGLLLIGLFSASALAQTRQDILLNNGWRTVAHDQKEMNQGFESVVYNDKAWKQVSVPHNWDTYEGYRRMKHGNRHGYAWYRKNFIVKPKAAGQRYFLWFEGVSSYATVWLNGKKVGYHAGGRTSFTIDITTAVKLNGNNTLAVRADHPAFIKDLPWVCGGCSEEVGFSEGSQPMGVFRPVHLIVTNEVRVEPFGVHIWNDSTVSEKSATLNLQTEVKNYAAKSRHISINNMLVDAGGKVISAVGRAELLAPGKTVTVSQVFSNLSNVRLWSLEDPYLYTVVTQVKEGNKLLDEIKIPYGVRWISWPIGRNNNDKRFFLNGKPVFINGTAEYEHLMGKSHAFTDEDIRTRVMQIRAAGYNAFRDAHQPHNLRYQDYWDKLGLLWWPQLSAHIWYDTPEFRQNYKQLLIEWVKERRNSPSIILWGLENESKLPTDFARECTELIRKLDPTASSQRKVTTCNGGTGTDWDVPQNWTGTYGGNPETYDQDVERQVLIGEYGAWRRLDLHTEGPFVANGALSEDRMTQLMETKIRLAESARDKTTGQFHWLLYSHENPGRAQSGEGYRDLDRVGPINYKGLFTPWGEPLDVFYMFRANYAPKLKEPMVYIVSHTWPNRWLKPGKKDSIIVYSNCDEVELFNDVNKQSLGRKKHQGIGTHFQWDGVDIKYNVLYAVGYVNGKAVTKDYIVLNHLPAAPGVGQLNGTAHLDLKPVKGYRYLYRLNCGGPEYTDKNGNIWNADVHQSSNKTYGSRSWTDDFPGVSPFFGSQRRSFDPVKGTNDAALFQTFRYGMDKLKFNFPVPDGDYLIELYFNEPWYGIDGGMDCTGWRLFDVAVNNKTVIKDLDIWKEAGVNRAIKKVVKAHISEGQLSISFPNIKSGEAIISAIAIASIKKNIKPAPASPSLIQNLSVADQPSSNKWKVQHWMDYAQLQYADDQVTFNALPGELYGAEWIKTPKKAPMSNDKPIAATFNAGAESDVYIAINGDKRPEWLSGYSDTKTKLINDASADNQYKVYKRRVKKSEQVVLGSNNDGPMYTVAVVPATTLDPAYDLKPTVSYRAETASAEGNAIADSLSGRKVIRFTKPAGGAAVFTISPGVADTYALRVKYNNPTNKTLQATLELRAADGLLLKTEILTFIPSQKGKWPAAGTTTAGNINAGNYKMIITAVDAEGLNISGVEFQ